MKPLLQKPDCVRLPVPDLESGLSFYRDRLGRQLLWRTEDSAALRLPDSDCELLLFTRGPDEALDWRVDSADRAADSFAATGGSIAMPPFDIPVGRAAVVRDPWGNTLVLLDLSKGTFVTDAEGNVTGVKKA
ncbi:MAG: VOC family protein [Anaerolineales bacterium]|nr:VOC family protein [Anaerolineales bacterium]